MSQEPEQNTRQAKLSIAESDGQVALQIPIGDDEDEVLTVLLSIPAARDLASSVDMVANLIELGEVQS